MIFSKKRWVFTLLSILPPMGLSAIASNPAYTNQIRDLLDSPQRKVLAETQVKIQNKNRWLFLKVQDQKSIVLEIYTWEEEIKAAFLQQRIRVPERRDAHIPVNDVQKNIIVENINSDPYPEIIFPVLNENLKGRLVVLYYDESRNTFDLLN